MNKFCDEKISYSPAPSSRVSSPDLHCSETYITPLNEVIPKIMKKVKKVKKYQKKVLTRIKEMDELQDLKYSHLITALSQSTMLLNQERQNMTIFMDYLMTELNCIKEKLSCFEDRISYHNSPPFNNFEDFKI